MKLIKANSPYIRRPATVSRMMKDVLTALLPVVVFALVKFGWDALYVMLLALVTMIGAELVFVFFTKQDPEPGKSFKEKIKTAYHNASSNNITVPAVSALIYALILPAGTRPYIVVMGALIGIVFGKLVFGGLGSNIFNPAALGRVVVLVCFGSDLKYISPSEELVSGCTPLAGVKESPANIGNFKLNDLFYGNMLGSMGEISALMILIGGIYLLIRRSADWRIPFSVIFSFMILMLFAGFSEDFNPDAINPVEFMLFHMLTGGFLFGAFFMLTDPVTSPDTSPGRITYGIIAAVICALIRLFGAHPEGMAFAILLTDMLVPVIDNYRWRSTEINYKHLILWELLILVPALIIML